MSLEAVIEANTKAVEALTAKLTALGMVASAPAPAALPPKQAAEAEQRKKSVPAAAAKSEPAEKAYTHEDAKSLTLKLAAKSRDTAVELLGKFGAKKAPELKLEDLAAFCTEAEKLLA